MSAKMALERVHGELTSRLLLHQIMHHYLRGFFYSVARRIVFFVLWFTWYVEEV